MPDMSFRLELEQPAVPDSVPISRSRITEFCEQHLVDDEVTARIRLAVTEACTNCVLHAYGSGARPGSTYMLEASGDGDVVVVVVNDCGIGVERAAATSGFGFGLRLIDDAADGTVVLSRPGHGTRVLMRFAKDRKTATGER